MTPEQCEVEGCLKQRGYGIRRYCKLHYERIRKFGDPHAHKYARWRNNTGDRRYVQQRCFTTVDGCWQWTGRLDRDGYGLSAATRGDQRAHRLAWRIYRSAIPEHLVVDHLCRHRSCVNPDHLELVTTQVNTARGNCGRPGERRGPTRHHKGAILRCGHPNTENNIRLIKPPAKHPEWSPRRRCIVCERASARRQRDKLKAA